MLIDLHNAKVFIDGRTILDNVHLCVNESDFVYVVGRVGSGKSTLLKMLYGELESKGERLNVLGCDLKKHVPKPCKPSADNWASCFKKVFFWHTKT